MQETGPFDKELVALVPKSLKYICHNGAGYDNVDVDALTQRGTAACLLLFLILASLADTIQAFSCQAHPSL